MSAIDELCERVEYWRKRATIAEAAAKEKDVLDHARQDVIDEVHIWHNENCQAHKTEGITLAFKRFQKIRGDRDS